MNIELMQDGKFINEQRYQDFISGLRDTLFRKVKDPSTNEVKLEIHFVGIIWYQDSLYLSLPKSIQIKEESNKKDVLLKYAKILQKYREHLKSPAHSYLSDKVTVDSWCEAIVTTTVKTVEPKEIIAFKFENVYEWMLGIYFNNQIRSAHNRILFNSHFIEKEVDINDIQYNAYHWLAIGKRSKDHKQKQIIEERDRIFINQDKKNIPDIVCERMVENPKFDRPQKSCCIIDAKYYGWDEQKEAYYLPKNLDIYKQFFYQEQFQRIYKIENSEDVGVYNFLILPDYLGDTKDTKWGIIRQCAVIEFDYHPGQSIAILQIDIDKLIECILNEDYEQDLLIALLGNNRVKPME